MLLVGAPTAAAKEGCWLDVVNDWYDNGRVDKTYALSCYQEAMDNLPDDVEIYSSAKEDISRALQQAVRRPKPSKDRAGRSEGERDPGTAAPVVKKKGGGGDDGPIDSGNVVSDRDKGGVLPTAIEKLGPDSADSAPLPLIVLAALSLLFLAAGAISFITRRVQARRVPVAAPVVSRTPEQHPTA